MAADITKTAFDFLKKHIPDAFKEKPLAAVPPDVVRGAYDAMMHTLHASYNVSSKMSEAALLLSYFGSGRSGCFNQIQTFFSALNQQAAPLLPGNMENVGYTFITRPRLCLAGPNLRSTRTMIPLDTANNTTTAFAIRTLLDTNLLNGRLRGNVTSSPLVDYQNPFMVPLCNSITGMNGAPDITLQYTTTEGGFMTEAQSFVLGGDNLQRANYQFTMNFRDIQEGPIAALFYYWIEYIRCVTRGIMLAYPDDIDEQVINYTVSVYRFLTDPSRTYITKWLKLTGCFPIGLPIGNMFNINSNQTYSSSSYDLSIQFVANRAEYMDYAILMDFNTLVSRYCPTINETMSGAQHEPDDNGNPTDSLLQANLPQLPISNFRGIPYITSDHRGVKLVFRESPNPAMDMKTDDIVFQLTTAELRAKIMENPDMLLGLENVIPEYYRRSTDSGDSIRDVVAKMVAPDVPVEPEIPAEAPAPPVKPAASEQQALAQDQADSEDIFGIEGDI